MSSNPNDRGSSGKNHHAEKVAQIQEVLDEADVDLWRLRGLALTEGGLVNGMYYCSKRASIYRTGSQTFFTFFV